MKIEILLLLFLFQIKHWLIDFVWQTTEMVNHKGIYGHALGIKHSALHGVGTGVCLLFIAILFGVPIGFAFGMALMLADIITHYHIDWAKMNFGSRDIYSPSFWNHLGLDQLAHQVVYLGIAVLISWIPKNNII